MDMQNSTDIAVVTTISSLVSLVTSTTTSTIPSTTTTTKCIETIYNQCAATPWQNSGFAGKFVIVLIYLMCITGILAVVVCVVAFIVDQCGCKRLRGCCEPADTESGSPPHRRLEAPSPDTGGRARVGCYETGGPGEMDSPPPYYTVVNMELSLSSTLQLSTPSGDGVSEADDTLPSATRLPALPSYEEVFGHNEDNTEQTITDSEGGDQSSEL